MMDCNGAQFFVNENYPISYELKVCTQVAGAKRRKVHVTDLKQTKCWLWSHTLRDGCLYNREFENDIYSK